MTGQDRTVCLERGEAEGKEEGKEEKKKKEKEEGKEGEKEEEKKRKSRGLSFLFFKMGRESLVGTYSG